MQGHQDDLALLLLLLLLLLMAMLLIAGDGTTRKASATKPLQLALLKQLQRRHQELQQSHASACAATCSAALFSNLTTDV